MSGLPCTARWWYMRLRVVVISVFVVLGCGAFAAQETSLYSLVPRDCPVTASVDAPWLWKTTAGLRAIDDVSKGLQMMERGLGLSLQNDLLSWAGQTAFVLTDIRQDGPRWALFLQIRPDGHVIKSSRLETLLQSMLAGQSKVTWVSMDYKGIAIRRAEIRSGRSVLKIATATVDGWLVLTFGDGVIRQVIDTRNGDSPSLAKHPLFSKAMGGLSANAPGQLCVNGQGILAQIAKNDARMAERLKDAELGKFFLASTMTYPNESLQFDAVYCTSSPTTQATLKQLCADAGTISGTSLAQLPQGSIATLLVRNPDRWVGAVEQMILHSAREAERQEMIRHDFAEIDGLRAVLQRCSGEMAASVIWREGKGFGVVMAAESGTDASAATAAMSLKSFLEQQEMRVEKSGGLYTLPITKDDGEIFASLLCWTNRKQWLLGASHPTWITPPAHPPVLLPAGLANANLAAFGNFSFLPSLLKSMGVDAQMLAPFAVLKLDTQRWAYAMRIDEDGGAVRCHITGGLPIIAVTAAVAYPVFAQAREKARQTASLSNLRQLAMSALMYAQDNEECLPVMKTPADIKKHLNVLDKILVSPRTNEPYTPNPFVSGKGLGAFDDATTMILFYEKTPGAGGSRCAAFLDGHVEVIPASRWGEAKRLAKIP